MKEGGGRESEGTNIVSWLMMPFELLMMSMIVPTALPCHSHRVSTFAVQQQWGECSALLRAQPCAWAEGAGVLNTELDVACCCNTPDMQCSAL